MLRAAHTTLPTILFMKIPLLRAMAGLSMVTQAPHILLLIISFIIIMARAQALIQISQLPEQSSSAIILQAGSTLFF